MFRFSTGRCRRRLPSLALVTSLLVMGIWARAEAQSRVQGQVVQIDGRGAAGVFVEYEETATGANWRTTTDDEGHYELLLGDSPTLVEDEATVPRGPHLWQNYPNPFNPNTTIRYTTQTSGRTSLVVYNALGQPVRRLVDGWVAAGSYVAQWEGLDDDGRAAAAGVYLYRLTAASGQTRVRKMLLVDGAVEVAGSIPAPKPRQQDRGAVSYRVRVFGRTIDPWQQEFRIESDARVDLMGIHTVPPLAIVDVTVVAMDEGRTVPGQTVVVRGGRIDRIGPADDVELPADAQVLDGTGRYLAPGLMDMHVHLALSPEDAQRELDLLLAHGVTTVRHSWGNERVLTQRGAIDSGRVIGPRLHVSSPGIDGSGGGAVSSPADARAAVEAAAMAGYDFIEIWGQLGAPEFEATMAAAAARGLRVMGQVPQTVGYDQSLSAGMASVEHLYEFGRRATSRGADVFTGVLDTTMAMQMAQTYGASATFVTPLQRVGARTGADIEQVQRQDAFEYIPRSQREDWLRGSMSVIPHHDRVSGQRALVLAELDRAGARIMAGSEAGNGFFIYGQALWEEMAEMGLALEPYGVLQAATRVPARFLGVEDQLGLVEEGYLADLILLDEDPLQDVGAVHSLVGTVVHGRWVPREDVLDRLAAKRAAELAVQPRNDCGEPYAGRGLPPLMFSTRQTSATTNAVMTWNTDHYLKRTFVTSTGDLPYRLFVPETAGEEPLPLVLFLHGGGGRGSSNYRQITYGSAPIPYLLANPEAQARHPAFVVAPQAAEQEWFDSRDPVMLSVTSRAILDLLDSLQTEFSIDERRIYVLGSSLGGAGTWALITKAPDVFAAAIPMSQAARWTRLPHLDAERRRAVRTLIDRGTAIWYFYGSIEGNPPLKLWWDQMKSLFIQEGIEHRSTEFYNTGHGVISFRAFAWEDPIEWMFSKCHASR